MVVGRGVQGIGFAVPSSLAKRRGADPEEGQGRARVDRRRHPGPDSGKLANALKLPDPHAGVLINKVEENGPGREGEHEAGRRDRSGRGQARVGDGRELVREILQHDVAQTVQLEIIRDGKHYGSKATLAPKAEAAVPPLPVQQQGVPLVGPRPLRAT